MNLIKPKRERDEKYLAWIRTLPCIVTGVRLVDIEAHHVRAKGEGGVGTKPDDRRAVPLSSAVHRHYHEVGRDLFEAMNGVNLESEILRLNREYQALNVKPSRSRTQGVRLKLDVTHCPNCNRAHRVPLSKVQFGKGVVHFWCITKRDYVEAKIA